MLIRAALMACSLAAGGAQAQLPSSAEWDQAVQLARPQAARAGLTLQDGSLWRQALQRRSPLVSAFGQGVCHLGFSPYAPGPGHAWLFPPLPADERALWLGGALRHELAHCADQASAPPPHPGGLLLAGALPAGGPAPAPQHSRHAEVLADLAFALHLDADHSARGARLVGLLGRLRAAQATQDPDHDTHQALQCYLAWRGRLRPEGGWLAQLQAWRHHCATGPAGHAAADARQTGAIGP